MIYTCPEGRLTGRKVGGVENQQTDLGFDTSKAACRGKHVSMFYPDPEQAKKRAYALLMADAVKVCEGCEVKEPCLRYAIQNEPTGIWGGTTEIQRHRLRLKEGVLLPSMRPLPDSVRRRKLNKVKQND